MTKTLQPGEFIELLNYLADTLAPEPGQGKPTCDGTLTRTQKWLAKHGYRDARQLAALEAITAGGAACDCEVILNANSVGEAIAGPPPEGPVN